MYIRLKRQQRNAFLGFDRHAVVIPALAGFTQANIDRLHNLMPRFLFAPGADGDLVVATVRPPKEIFSNSARCAMERSEFEARSIQTISTAAPRSNSLSR